MLQEGRLEDAIEMDIKDIRNKFGNKYDVSIEQMKEYAKSLDPEQFIAR